jgi:hypothetical protein
MSSIYLMKNMSNGYYKIGSSRRPPIRERTLQAQEPDVRLLATVEADSVFERKLHRRYTAKRLRGEWFALELGDLYELCREFGVDVQQLNPPIHVFEDSTWRAAIHRLSPRADYTWVTYRSKQFLFEMPFAMSKCDVEELVIARAFSCALPEELLDVLSTSLRNYLQDVYEIDNVKVELRELRCMASGESRGYIVVDQHGHDRFFQCCGLAKDSAQKYFKWMCRYHDGYVQRWRDADVAVPRNTDES